MSPRIRISIILGIVVFAVILIRCIIKNKLSLKYTLTWFSMLLVMLISVIFDDVVMRLATLLGFKSIVNFVLSVFILFSILILVSLTSILSHMTDRVYELVQTVAIMDKRLRELEKKCGSDKS